MREYKNKILRKITLIKKEGEKFFRIFLFLFLLTIIIINWGTIKGMFNYKAIYGQIYEEISSSFKDIFSEEKEVALKVPQLRLSEPEFEVSDKPNSLEIPRIGLTAPLIFSENASKSELERLLKQGVVFYPDSVLPGEEGLTVILGHSAPPSWPKINYDWVFTRLNELEEGDEVFLYFNHRKYPYLVTEKVFLKKGDDIPAPDLSNSRSILTMLSCWPPGIDYKRIAVQAELQI
jgi:LPXTG-site transpeptidase (sortase) family protein